MLGFIGNHTNYLPKRLYHLTFALAVNERSLCSTSPSVGAVIFLGFDHSNRYIVVSYCCFQLLFPDDICCGTSFHMLIYHLYILFRDLTEADDIMKRCKDYTEELYKKGLYDPDNHNGVITHLEPEILECEVIRKHHYKQS